MLALCTESPGVVGSNEKTPELMTGIRVWINVFRAIPEYTYRNLMDQDKRLHRLHTQ